MALIIIGSVLIGLQLIADIGNLYLGGLNYFSNVTNFSVFIYDLIGFSAYSLVGSAGVLLLIIGINKARKNKRGSRKNTSKPSEKTHTNKYNLSPIWESVAENLNPKAEEKTNNNKPCSINFCRECSALIDQTTKKCTGCGIYYDEDETASLNFDWFKDFFKTIKYYLGKIFSKKSVLPIILSGLLSISIICNIVQAMDINSYKDIVDDQHNTIEEKTNTIFALIDAGYEDWMKLQFYENNVVVVSDDGTNLYHKYGCEDFDDSYFWAYNKEYAEFKGYVPHKRCCE